MNKIKIVCDSLSDISQDYLDLYDIDMLPLSIIIDGVEYKDRIDIDGEKFYKLLREEGVIPKTSQVTYGAFYENFKKHCGLECGILLNKLRHKAEAISIGPNMFNVHTPQEHVEVDSVARMWKFIIRLLEVL